MTKTASDTVLYNGQCPICSAEIAHYRQYCEDRDIPLAFEDLTGSDLRDWGLSQEDAARRLHVRTGDEVLSGLPAFQRMWAAMPRYRWLARLTGLPLVRQATHTLYEKALAPALYRRHVRRCAAAEKVAKEM